MAQEYRDFKPHRRSGFALVGDLGCEASDVTSAIVIRDAASTDAPGLRDLLRASYLANRQFYRPQASAHPIASATTASINTMVAQCEDQLVGLIAFGARPTASASGMSVCIRSGSAKESVGS
jgi:hypothetical protein